MPTKPKPEPEPENKGQGATVYTVLQLVTLYERQEMIEEPKPVEAWTEIGRYTAMNNQAAVKTAMDDHGLEEGDFRAIPETSSKVLRPRVNKRTVWT